MRFAKSYNLILGVLLLFCATLSFSATRKTIVDNEIHAFSFHVNDYSFDQVYYIADECKVTHELPNVNSVLFSKTVATTNHLFTTKGITIRKSWHYRLKLDINNRKNGNYNSKSITYYSTTSYKSRIYEAKVDCQSDLKIGWNKAVNGVA